MKNTTTVMVIDSGWYLIVARLFSNPRWLAVWFERIFGSILVLLAGRLVMGILTN